jgi:hypothetical protein
VNELTEPGKRIVNKGRYVANTMNKAVLTALGAAIVVMGVVGMAFTCFLMIPMLWGIGVSDVSLLPILIFAGGSSALLFIGMEAIKSGKAMDVGVPLTRATTAHLPAANSLVRASQEPVQDQGAILLRATIQTQDTLPEEMLRAASEPGDTEQVALR